MSHKKVKLSFLHRNVLVVLFVIAFAIIGYWLLNNSRAASVDFNNDGKVDIYDLSILLTNYGKTGRTFAQGDTDGNGMIDVNDLNTLLSNWGGVTVNNCTTTISAPSSISSAESGMSAGGVLCLHGGTYNQQVTLSKQGTSSSPITVKSYPGEIAVIDGTGLFSVSQGCTSALVEVSASYVVVSNVTIQKSGCRGIHVTGNNNQFDHNLITQNGEASIDNAGGTNGGHNKYVSNEVSNNVLNWNGDCRTPTQSCSGSSGGWPCNIDIFPISQKYADIFQGNNIHNNWGEGICTAVNDQLIGNTIHDNWSVDVYLEKTSGVVVDGNLIYESETNYPSGGPQAFRLLAKGITFADEDSSYLSNNNTVRNNIILNTSVGLRYTNYVSGSGLISDIIDNNTIVNTWDYGIQFDSGAHSGTLIRDNIVVPRQGSLTSGIGSGMTATANLFTTKGASNDPLLPGEGSFSFDPNNYKLQSSSASAIDKGVSTSATTDYFGTSRPQGSAYDIGAYELIPIGITIDFNSTNYPRVFGSCATITPATSNTKAQLSFNITNVCNPGSDGHYRTDWSNIGTYTTGTTACTSIPIDFPSNNIPLGVNGTNWWQFAEAKTPPTQFADWGLYVRNDSGTPRFDFHMAYVTGASTNGTSFNQLWTGGNPTTGWNTFVICSNYSTTTSGFIDLYLNGTKVWSASGVYILQGQTTDDLDLNDYTGGGPAVPNTEIHGVPMIGPTLQSVEQAGGWNSAP